ncbi:hypothetical protein [Rothia nasimurium]|uniref:hypothetical protein n=1 Tax=Rothia nasimurium TaxID=85336 RepID=UPI001F251E12|nr:hypothetical protein [Rothia nasimurium]
MKRFITLCALAGTLFMSSCGSGNVAPPVPAAAPSSSSQPTESPTSVQTTAAPINTPTTSGKFENGVLWQRGVIPAGAVTLPETTQHNSSDTAYLQTPTGNIGCDFYKDRHYDCTVLSYIADKKYPIPFGSSYMHGSTFDLSDTAGPVEIDWRGGAPGFVQTNVNTYTVPYGQTVTYGNMVCDSQENGLTCANIVTGQGVFMSREGYRTFSF